MENVKKQRIFNYLNKALSEQSIKDFTIDKMALDLKMSKKTIYQIFPNKEAVISDYIFSILHHFRKEIDDIQQSNINSLEKLIHFLYKVIQNIVPLLQKHSWILKSKYPEIWNKVERYRKETLQSFLGIFNDLEQQGYTNKSISPDLFNYLFTNIIQGTIQPEFLLNAKWSMDEIVRSFILLMFQGALTTDASTQIQKIMNKL